ncbi:glutathione peroxidase [Plakobranchus ocellatus]|uniref:Glutathione peroxidase n=1 Tax=Plakobranchus ocellatus TaxID=259542 RepID=A0AAV4D3U0_9GAST|nr:glutathione peroxidase [Plakobranchus ocellatus]
MNALNSKYGGQGLVVLGFPCNLFLKQEPGANGTEILNGVKYVRPGNGFVPNFQLFEKIDVNGDKEHQLYTYLKRHCPPTTSEFKPSNLFYTPIRSNDVSWNWEKFLVGPDGRVMKRAPPGVEPEALEDDIEEALASAPAGKNVYNKVISGFYDPPSGRGADGAARTRARRVPADLRVDSQATVPPTPSHMFEIRNGC